MPSILAIFFLIYGGMHLYALQRLRAAFPFRLRAAPLLYLFMCLMVAAPVLVRFLERSGAEDAARVFSYVGYSWMGVIWLFFTFSIAFEGARILWTVLEVAFGKRLTFCPLPPFMIVLVPFTLSLAATAYGFFEARHIRVERVTVESDKIPVTAEG